MGTLAMSSKRRLPLNSEVTFEAMSGLGLVFHRGELDTIDVASRTTTYASSRSVAKVLLFDGSVPSSPCCPYGHRRHESNASNTPPHPALLLYEAELQVSDKRWEDSHAELSPQLFEVSRHRGE